ncbi:MAG: hypothetical protein L6300_15235 [Syntrophaceae bacterium]|nr:hypothetical protein [Syntrophaceae bacterium]
MIVLDTHVWIWWVSNPALLSEEARRIVDGAAADKGDLHFVDQRLGGCRARRAGQITPHDERR